MEKRDSAKKRKTKEKITEVFTIEQPKKESDDENIPEEKTIIQHAEIEKKEEEPSKKDVKKENKIIRNAFIILAGLVILFFVIYGVSYYTNHFEVEGVKFERVKIGQLILYQTSLPGKVDIEGNFIPGIYETGQKADYNLYFRNDPRILKNTVPFHEVVSQVKKENVIQMEENFDCNGYGVIAVANLANMYKSLGGNIIKDENATCDKMGRYGLVNIKNGDETEIERFGPACFNIYINDCEILEGTEKFMLETLIEINSRLEK